MKIDLKPFPLMQLPTPLHRLPRFSAWLDAGVEVWIKRDDLTGMALGGNKLRKLSYLVADALEQGATDLVTTGAAQSNHCRQTAAAAARANLGCHLVLRGHAADRPGGNVLLDDIFGATLHWSGATDATPALAAAAAALEQAGRRPYVIPLGGSTPLGAAGYAFAWSELAAQAQPAGLTFDAVVFATSSGGTQAGLCVGAGAEAPGTPVLAGEHGPGGLVGISVDHTAAHLQAIANELTAATARLLGVAHPRDAQVVDAYLGGGYGVVGERERKAIFALARTEGLLVDPVYTGRALGGLIDLSRQGALRGRVLFWHTGGIPALFAYEEELRSV